MPIWNRFPLRHCVAVIMAGLGIQAERGKSMFKFGTFFCFFGIACLYAGFGTMFSIGATTETMRFAIVTLLGAGFVNAWLGAVLWSIALKGTK